MSDVNDSTITVTNGKGKPVTVAYSAGPRVLRAIAQDAQKKAWFCHTLASDMERVLFSRPEIFAQGAEEATIREEVSAGLLPCPFCGPGKSMCAVDEDFRYRRARFRVCCGRCGSSTGTHFEQSGAVAAWNTRP